MASDAFTLCYHAVSRSWEADLSIAPDRLEAQLRALAGRGYRAAPFADVARGRAPGRAVAVTFDDAFASVHDLALPLLDRLGMTGTVFVPTDYPDSGRPMAWAGLERWMGTPHEHELACMTWDQLRDLQERGWEIASHTCSHPALTRLDDQALEDELARSRQVCADRLGTPCEALAYPYGDQDERVARAAAAAGYTAAGALSGRFHRDAPLRAPRVGIYHGDDMRRFKLKASRVTRGLRSSRLWGWLDDRRAGSTAPTAATPQP
jgi:peptidoglycan/xylan/chitin deacetylase (PgdA/CDA1 family)